MSNNFRNPSDAEMVRKLHESMFRGGENSIADSIGNADPDEKLELKTLDLSNDELILFNDAPDCVYRMTELIEKSELNNAILSIMQGIFADVFSAQLVYSAKYNKWMFVLEFRYITDDQFNNMPENKNLTRALESSFNPSNKSRGIAETLISISKNQSISSSDASKYAKLTKQAKENLTFALFFSKNNKKKKWVKGENYNINYTVQNGYNGTRYSNIIASVYLDAEKIIEALCITKEDRDKNKYKIAIAPYGTKMNNMDEIFAIHRYSKAKRRKIATKYGVTFND